MTPVFQRVLTGLKGQGDCSRACVASILDLPYEVVPALQGSDWWVQCAGFFAQQGYTIRYHWDRPHLSGYYLGIMRYPGSDITHMVVMRDGEVAHDPCPNNQAGVLDCVISVTRALAA